MALKAVVSKAVHEKMPEAIKSEYKVDPENGDRFLLDVDSVDGLSLASVGQLQSAVAAARGERDEAQKKLKAWGDLTPEAAKAAADKLKEVEGSVEAKVKAQIDAAKKQLVDQHNAVLEKETKRRGALEGQVKELLRTNKAKAAIQAAGGNSDLLLPHVERFIELVPQEDGTFKERIIDPSTGQERIDDQAKPMKLESVVGELKKNEAFAGAFNGTGSTGTGGAGGGRVGGGPGGFTLAATDAKDPAKYRHAKDQAVKAGQELQIVDG